MQAEIILSFAERTFEDAENFVLARMLDNNADLKQIQADYRAAYAFYQKVKNTVIEGRLAQKTLRGMENNE